MTPIVEFLINNHVNIAPKIFTQGPNISSLDEIQKDAYLARDFLYWNDKTRKNQYGSLIAHLADDKFTRHDSMSWVKCYWRVSAGESKRDVEYACETQANIKEGGWRMLTDEEMQLAKTIDAYLENNYLNFQKKELIGTVNKKLQFTPKR